MRRPRHTAPATAPQRIEVRYKQAPSVTPDECRRRVRLAYSLLLGLTPWPQEPKP